MENNNQTNFNFALQHEQHDKRHQELQKRAIYGTCKYPNCGGVCDSRLTPNIPDKYGEIYCRACDSFQTWLPYPKNQKKKRKKSGNKLIRQKIPHNLKGFCEMCLRGTTELKTLNLKLEVHHVIPIDDNGNDEAENLRLVCSQCHSSIHRQRELVARYRIYIEQEHPKENKKTNKRKNWDQDWGV